MVKGRGEERETRIHFWTDNSLFLPILTAARGNGWVIPSFFLSPGSTIPRTLRYDLGGKELSYFFLCGKRASRQSRKLFPPSMNDEI